MKIWILILCLGITTSGFAEKAFDELAEISYTDRYAVVSSRLSFVEIQLLKEMGYTHILSFNTGLEYLQKSHAEALGITYQQVPQDLRGLTQEKALAYLEGRIIVK